MRTLYIIAFLALGAAFPLGAQIVAVDTGYNPGSGTYNSFADGRTYGWKFSIGDSAITVTELGLFDAEQNGFADAHRVGIWDSTGNLLIDTTISAGTSASLDGNFRFVSVTPTTLNANASYSIGALFPSANDTAIAFAPAPSYASEISYQTASFSAIGFNAPSTGYSGSHGVIGANFKGDLSAVPEPAHYAVMTGIGLFAFACVRKVRAKRMNPAA